MPGLKVAGLLSGEPGPQELWTLRAMASVPCELSVIQAAPAEGPPPLDRARTLVRKHGPTGALSRILGAAVGRRLAAGERERLEELFDFDDLRAWWRRSGIAPVKVSGLNRAEAEKAVSALAPDVIVRISGGILNRRVFSPARIAALNIHHGRAPLIRGMWSIPWGIVEGRRDWIGATVHLIDEGVDTGPILWRGGPQLAPGDTNVDLLFRAHLEAAEALARLLTAYASGDFPRPWLPVEAETSSYRSSARLRDWIKFLLLGRGRRARVLLERGIEC